MKINKKQLGNRIKKIRIEEKDTLEKFAEKIKKVSGGAVTPGKSNVSRWEKGENVPNDITLQAIADIGKITFNELLHGEYGVVYNTISGEEDYLLLNKSDLKEMINATERQEKKNFIFLDDNYEGNYYFFNKNSKSINLKHQTVIKNIIKTYFETLDDL